MILRILNRFDKPFVKKNCVELQWLEHLWDHGNLFSTRVVKVTVNYSANGMLSVLIKIA